MFGGDEVSAIVFALDSYTCKAGYTGKDAPKGRVFPSVVWAVDGVVAMDMDVDVDSSKTNSNSKDSKSEKEKGKRNLYVGSQALNYRKDHMEMVLFLIGIWRLTEEEAEWCWRWPRKKTRRKKEAEILEIGKRRMIVADPKVFTSGFSLDSRLELSWEWQKHESRRFSSPQGNAVRLFLSDSVSVDKCAHQRSFMYCGMISAVVVGIIPISPYTTVDDKALTAENLKVLGTPAREIIKVHPLLFRCKIQAKAKKKIGARF
uniref:Uncharacterized protein n=2 Tax=Brassica oleracea TaxID=3712 RepID=A0A0D3DLQ6_BRAOL